MSDPNLEDELMWGLASVLAKSGAYSGWRDIESKLVARGYCRAHRLLADATLRERLTESALNPKGNRG